MKYFYVTFSGPDSSGNFVIMGPRFQLVNACKEADIRSKNAIVTGWHEITEQDAYEFGDYYARHPLSHTPKIAEAVELKIPPRTDN